MSGTTTLAELARGGALFSDGDWVESKDQDPDGGVRLVQLADVGDGWFRDRSDRSLTQAKANELGCTFLEAGDVLVARMPEPLGRACIYPGGDRPAVTAVDVCIVRPGPAVDARWLMLTVNSPQFRREVAALQSGTTRKRISRKNLGMIPFRLPLLGEQRAIVEEIEKQFTRLDAAEVSAGVATARLLRLRRSMVAIVSRVSGPDVEQRPFELAFETISDRGRRVEASRYLAAGKLPVVDQGAGDIGGYTNDNNVGYEGPLPVVIFGDHTRRVKFVDYPFAVGAQGVKILRPKDGLLADFAAYVLEGIDLPDRGYGRHFALLRKVVVPVPPLDRQESLVSVLKEEASLVAGVQDQVEVIRRRSVALRAAVLRDAFAGELVIPGMARGYHRAGSQKEDT